MQGKKKKGGGGFRGGFFFKKKRKKKDLCKRFAGGAFHWKVNPRNYVKKKTTTIKPNLANKCPSYVKIAVFIHARYNQRPPCHKRDKLTDTEKVSGPEESEGLTFSHCLLA